MNVKTDGADCLLRVASAVGEYRGILLRIDLVGHTSYTLGTRKIPESKTWSSGMKR